MEREEVERIIDDIFARSPNMAGMFEIREVIVREVSERHVKPKLSDEDWKVFSSTIRLESLAAVYEQVSQFGDALPVDPERVKQPLFFYEGSRELCSFLLDNYERTSAYFQERVSKDNLVSLAADLAIEKENMELSFADGGRLEIKLSRFGIMLKLSNCLRAVLLGEEEFNHFAAECNDAFVFAREHPLCKSFLSFK